MSISRRAPAPRKSVARPVLADRPDANYAPKVENTSMKACKNCGHKEYEDAVFCTNCGSKFDSHLFCPNCGVNISESDQFCTSCGFKLHDDKSKCPNCGQIVTQGDVFCTNCGNRLQ